MKRKIVFILALSAIISFGYALHATTPNDVLVECESQDTPIGEKIILHGSLLTGTGPNAIEAYVTDDNVYIQFNQNFGNVSISLYDALSNLIYNSNVNTDVQSLVIIPINSPVEGTFILELNSINGGAEGDFEHNND